jgi:hypothetical protein
MVSVDGREGDDEMSGYRIDIWPESHSDPTLLKESEYGRYWNRNRVIEVSAQTFSAAVDGELDDRFERFLRLAFEQRPDLRADAGDGYWRDALLGQSLAAWPRQFQPGQREAILDRVLSDD